MRLAVSVRVVPVVRRSVFIPGFTAIVAGKGHEEKPEHIERSDESCNDADEPVDPAPMIAGVRLPQYFVFAPKAREWRDASDSQRRDAHGRGGDGYIRPKPAHLAHVLLAADCVNH